MRKSDPISIDAGREDKQSKRTKSSSETGEKTSSAAKRGSTRQSAGASSSKGDKASSRGRSSKQETSNKSEESGRPEQQAGSSGNDATARLPENHHSNLHDRSYAAHLDAGSREPHTKPAGDLRFLAPFPTGRKQP